MKETPSQTIGPFFHDLVRPGENILVSDSTVGERIRLEGLVFDGEAKPVTDGMIEIWQANADGHYYSADNKVEKSDHNFIGYGRSDTDDRGHYWFETIKPGPVPGLENTIQAPHLNVIVFARGMLLHAFTRIYFANEPANQSDPVLLSIENQIRRDSLIASDISPGNKLIYRFNIYLQGENETVFFDA